MSSAILAALLAVGIFIATMAAFLLYLRHWGARNYGRVTEEPLTEGYFLKRYIPQDLRPKYDELREHRRQRQQMTGQSMQRWFMGLFATASLCFLAAGLWMNRNRLLPGIDLTEGEVASLDLSRHAWKPRTNGLIPKMDQVLPTLRQRGIALIAAPEDYNRTVNGQRITAQGQTHWKHAVERWKVPLIHCRWNGLMQCLGNRIGVVLPGQWDFSTLNATLKQGADILAYGPPTQLFSSSKSSLRWAGLRFERYSTGTPAPLALRGDQVLTLGLDAGLVIEAAPAFSGYRVFSESPQAVTIASDHTIGGDIDTRLYASRVGAGRLVWMGHAPDYQDQDSDISVTDLEAVNTAIFRYLMHRTYSAWATWPQGRRFAGFISEDSEDKYHYASEVVDLVREYHLPITWFILSNLAQKHRALTRDMAEVGEIACHGDSHAGFPEGKLSWQAERLARCRKVLKKITGQEPVGFRPPEERYNGETIDAVSNTGFAYYFAESGGSRAVPTIMVDGQFRSLVSIPRFTSDDYEMWHTQELDGHDSLALATHELKWISMLGGLYSFDFHTQYMNRARHRNVVRYVGTRLKRNDCFFTDVSGIAQWWRARSRLMAGKTVKSEVLRHFSPILLTVDSEGRMSRRKSDHQTLSSFKTYLLTSHRRETKSNRASHGAWTTLTAEPMSPDAPPAKSGPQSPQEQPRASARPVQAPAARPGHAPLELTFTHDCWTEVYDRDERELVFDLIKAGESLSLEGKPPYRVLLGYAPGVAIRYRGHPIDALGSTRNGIATIYVGKKP